MKKIILSLILLTSISVLSQDLNLDNITSKELKNNYEVYEISHIFLLKTDGNCSLDRVHLEGCRIK